MYEELQKMVDGSSRIVFFGGAGVSTESGIPDFRSVDGLYNQKYDVPPETILSHSYFMKYPKKFYEFYRDKMMIEGVKPNAAHYKLAEMEQKGKLIGIVTQNIDGLHQAAGSKKVFELHGSILRNYCMKCGMLYDLDYVRDYKKTVPKCRCGGTIKPDVVLYEEQLDSRTIYGAVECISNADMLIVAGTSLTVYPAAGMVEYFRGDRIVLINRDETPLDGKADLVIHDKVGKVLDGLII